MPASKTVMDVFMVGLNGTQAVGSYKEARGKGSGVVGSVGKAAFDFAFYEMLGPWGIGLAGLQVAGAAAQVAHQYGYVNANLTSKAYKSNFGGNYIDNQVSATMRQRGIQAMQTSGLQGYSTLGNEARAYFK